MVVDQSRKIFHESWYRIAKEKVALRSTVRIHRQFYRGVLWYVLYEPFTNQHFRFRENTYRFISRLSPNKTVEDIWIDLLKEFPDDAPGQGEIIELLSSLYQSNMLHYGGTGDGSRLFERDSKKKKKKLRSTLLNIFFLRIPLVDPDPLLKRLKPLIRMVISKPMLLLWLVTVFFGIKIGIENFDILKDQAQGFLAPSNLIWIYVCTVFIKIIHEFGHSFAVRRFGGEVHTLGVMFMLLAPLPYMDATAAWSFREKRKRVLVGCGGILFELFVAALALIVWSNVGGGVIKPIAYNVFFIASISTLLFNANPLMRFDGYYILSDILDTPNLQQHSKLHLKYLLEKFAFRKTNPKPVANTLSEGFLYGFYGIASSIYRIILFTGIVIAISQHFLILSVIMGISLALSMVVIPFFHFLRYIFVSPDLLRVRNRAVSLTLIFSGILGVILFLIPVPDTFTAPGILEAQKYETIINKTTGQMKTVPAETETLVQSGESLFILENPLLENEIEEKKAALTENQLQFRRALNISPENMYPISKRTDVLKQESGKLLDDKNNLSLKSPFSGIWVSKDISNFTGKWIQKGDSMGILIDTSAFQFTAVVSQEEVSRLFASSFRKISIRLNGNAFTEIPVQNLRVIPIARSDLPSEALGWYGGGEIEVQSNSNVQTTEPFYLVHASLEKNASVLYLQGRSGKIRFMLGHQPLARQGFRKLRQAMQKYYRI